MQTFAPGLPLAVATSGGADSTALLILCAQRWPGQVVALHVNHGLQAAAADFEAHCVQLCADLGVPLRVAHVDARHAPGQSPEDAARRARYQALAALCGPSHQGAALQHIAVAQHADDQAETVLLALGRGAGLPGLSGMPERWQRHGLFFYRPLLSVPSADLRVFLSRLGQGHVEDPSNSDERFTRNRMRARLLPAYAHAFPAFRQTIARSAAHAAQAQCLLDELALLDLQTLRMPSVNMVVPAQTPDAAAPTQDPSKKGLRLDGLQALSPARLNNVLRYWLKHDHACLPSAAQLGALAVQIAACRTRGHHIHIKVGEGFAQRDQAYLTWYNPRVLL